jgi:hypothetical protein
MSLDPSLDTHRPFTRAQALASGVNPESSRFKRLVPGVYVASEVAVTPELTTRAALLRFGPDAFASHVSAARLRRVPVPAIPEEHVTVIRQEDRRRPRGVIAHVNPSPEVVLVRGVRVSSATQMFVELATLLSLVDLVVVGDHLVRTSQVSLAELVRACARSTERGARAARRAAAYVRERVDSPMETRLRMLIVLAGLPEPEVNLTIRDVDGRPLRRYDLCWRSGRVIVEYDGRHHIERDETWESDLQRREAIDDDGWRILVVTGRGIYREPERTVDRVWRLLRERGVPDVPARPRDDWRPHFPVR